MSAKRIDDHHYTGVVKQNGVSKTKVTEIWTKK